MSKERAGTCMNSFRNFLSSSATMSFDLSTDLLVLLFAEYEKYFT